MQHLSGIRKLLIPWFYQNDLFVQMVWLSVVFFFTNISLWLRICRFHICGFFVAHLLIFSSGFYDILIMVYKLPISTPWTSASNCNMFISSFVGKLFAILWIARKQPKAIEFDITTFYSSYFVPCIRWVF